MKESKIALIEIFDHSKRFRKFREINVKVVKCDVKICDQ